MSEKAKQINYRVREELANWLKNYAKENHRSVTAQLNLILQQEKQRVTAN